MRALRQGTAVTVSFGQFVVPDGITVYTSVPTVRVRKAGGAFGARHSASAVTHDENGFFQVPLDATDTDTAGPLRLAATDAANYIGHDEEWTILAGESYDVLVSAVAPAVEGVASTIWQMLAQGWRRLFKKATLTAAELKTYDDGGQAVLTTQAVSDDGATQTQGAAT